MSSGHDALDAVQCPPQVPNYTAACGNINFNLCHGLCAKFLFKLTCRRFKLIERRQKVRLVNVTRAGGAKVSRES